MSDPAGAFLGSRTTLRPAHAVAALLQLSDGRYLMQLRDSNPGYLLSGALGAASEGRSIPARRRQPRWCGNSEEELAVNVVPSDVTRFTEFTFDFGFAGDGVRLRTYYAVTLPQANLDGLVLGEGAESGCVRGREAACNAACGPVRRFRVMDAPCTRAACLVPSSCGPPVLGWFLGPEGIGAPQQGHVMRLGAVSILGRRHSGC